MSDGRENPMDLVRALGAMLGGDGREAGAHGRDALPHFSDSNQTEGPYCSDCSRKHIGPCRSLWS